MSDITTDALMKAEASQAAVHRMELALRAHRRQRDRDVRRAVSVAGYSEREVAERLGIAPSAVHRMVAGSG